MLPWIFVIAQILHAQKKRMLRDILDDILRKS